MSAVVRSHVRIGLVYFFLPKRKLLLIFFCIHTDGVLCVSNLVDGLSLGWREMKPSDVYLMVRFYLQLRYQDLGRVNSVFLFGFFFICTEIYSYS